MKAEDNYYLDATEFGGINFSLDWPLIVKDLAFYLIGVHILKGTKISEEDELPKEMAQEVCKDQDL